MVRSCLTLLIAVSSVQGGMYQVEFNDLDGPHWTGRVIGSHLIIDSWTENPGGLDYVVPGLPQWWWATTPGETVCASDFVEDGPYTVPDDWNGTIGPDWGFLGYYAAINPGIRPGWGAARHYCPALGGFNGPCTQYGELDLPMWQTSDGAFVGATADWIRLTKLDLPGDSNLDGLFNSADLVQVFVAGKYEANSWANWAEGDWDGSNLFNSQDIVLAFGGGRYEQLRSTGVPEPSALAMALAGLTLVLLRSRRSSAKRVSRSSNGESLLPRQVSLPKVATWS